MDEEDLPVPVPKLSWKPKTRIGRLIADGVITDIDTLIDSGLPIIEAEIVDLLLPELKNDLLLVGQSKGKFGGGQRRIFRQTQKKTKEGNKPHFGTAAVVGDENGHVGIGFGKSKETVPAREKAVRNAKKNIIKVRRGSGSWESNTTELHSIPYKVTGKAGSVHVTLFPAPKGTGLKIQGDCAKVLAMAGIKDVWSQTRGSTKSTINLIQACFNALKSLSEVKGGAQ
ncbi:30S ribosomal protein S5 [Candidatus Woesearchaeota archaeon CG1_02_57_44]|nr:MAG: 30S ribosomal protein S5 [Candidatus Woesearchaeota archaeon CG1_02_57_44]